MGEEWSDRPASTSTQKATVLSSIENVQNFIKYFNQKSSPKNHSKIPESTVPQIALSQQICLLMSISQTQFVEKSKKNCSNKNGKRVENFKLFYYHFKSIQEIVVKFKFKFHSIE